MTRYPAIKVLKIGVTGSREGATYRQLRTAGQAILSHCLIEYLPVELHHGDCVGFDELMHAFARALWFKPIIHPPQDDKFRAWCKTKPEYLRAEKPYTDRNRDIVDETHILVVGPDGEERERSGTWSTVRYARRLGRPIFIAMPDGHLRMEGRWP